MHLHKHIIQLMCSGRCSILSSGDNVWIHEEERPWSSLGVRGWVIEVLKLSSCSECLWSWALLLYPKKLGGCFAPCGKCVVLRAVGMVLDQDFKKITAFLGRKISSYWKSPWKGKHPISLSCIWISWLLKNVGLQSVLCQWPFSL